MVGEQWLITLTALAINATLLLAVGVLPAVIVDPHRIRGAVLARAWSLMSGMRWKSLGLWLLV
jgi:hypothetical protein